MPDVLHAIRHAPIHSPVLHLGARRHISSFLLSATQEMNRSNNHSTCAQNDTKRKTDRHTDCNIHSPFALCAAKPSATCSPHLLFVPWKCAAIPNPIVTSVSAGQGKKRGKKSNENDDFSLLKSGPVVCNLLRHSTSSASLFNNFVHRER